MLLWLALGGSALAQPQAPGIGYMYPPGGQAGSTFEVVLGGYDWTPDMDLFVRGEDIALELTGTPGPVIVPEPPYWFGKKARRSPFPMPRETPARLQLPSGLPAGIYKWQAANANGATASGLFAVSAPEDGTELVEEPNRREPQHIPQLPATVSGQILKIEEVDRYRFTAAQAGPVTCICTAAPLASPLTAVLEVRDASGRLIADSADTEAREASLKFAAQAGAEYVVSVYDLDFRGDRSFVYRLSIVPGPRIAAAVPASVRRGETREVEFIGYGVATGGDQLESVKAQVTSPSDQAQDSFNYRLQTPFGTAPAWRLGLSDLPETVETGGSAADPMPLAYPSALTGRLDELYGQDVHTIQGKQGDVWAISAEAVAIGSPLDVCVAVLDAEGKELHRTDDVPGTTDPAFEFTVPAEGTYRIVVSDISGQSGSPSAVYRLAVRTATVGFRLSTPELVNVPIGGTAQLAVTAARTGGFTGPIAVSVSGLPEGVSVPNELVIPEGKNDLKIDLTAAAEAGTAATFVSVRGSARIAEEDRSETLPPTLLALTMKPPFTIDAEGKDDVLKWPRGSTFPGPVLIEREAGFEGEIVLEMHSRQGRHRQGISGPELPVPPGVNRVIYPIYLPEWLETTRTSRMVVNGVAQVPDAKGRLRYLSSKLKTRIGFLPGGALLALECDVPEIEAAAGQPFEIPLTLSRAPELKEAALLELRLDDELEGKLHAEPVTVGAGQSRVVLTVIPSAGMLAGEHELTIRATVLQGGEFPVIAAARVLTAFAEAAGN